MGSMTCSPTVPTVFRAGKVSIWILKAGKLSKNSSDAAFTLLELIVVIVILSAFLIIIVPIHQRLLTPRTGSKEVNRLIRAVTQARQDAWINHRDYTLNITGKSGLIWVTHTGMSHEEQALAKDNARILSPESVNIDIIFPGQSNREISQDAQIRFYRQGYADAAIIRFSVKGHPIFLKIQPFLTEVQITEGDRVDDCL